MAKKIISSKNLKRACSLIIVLNIFSLNILSASADSLLSDVTCIQNGDCGINDFALLFVEGSKIILGLSGSAALLFFVIGGIMFLTSAGNQERVTRGKSMLSGAALGLILVFLSYTIIGFVLTLMGITDKKWFTSGWFSE